MKDKDLLRIQQLEETLKPFRRLAHVSAPNKGWIRAIREGLGMTNVQLAKKLRKIPQSIEDIQKSEINGTIQLKTIRRLAEGLGCRFVYAIVPPIPLPDMRRSRAADIARRRLRSVIHTMKLEDQAINETAEARQLEMLIAHLLADNPKKLWE